MMKTLMTILRLAHKVAFNIKEKYESQNGCEHHILTLYDMNKIVLCKQIIYIMFVHFRGCSKCRYTYHITAETL